MKRKSHYLIPKGVEWRELFHKMPKGIRREILNRVRKLTGRELSQIIDHFDMCYCYRIGEKEIKDCEYQELRNKIGLDGCRALERLNFLKQGKKIYYRGRDTAFVAELAKRQSDAH